MDETSKINLRDLIKPTPIGSVGGLGELKLHHVSGGVMKEFNKREDADTLSREAVVTCLIEALVEQADGTKLSPDKVAGLAQDDRASLVAAILANLPDPATEDEGENVRGDEPGITPPDANSQEAELARRFHATNEAFRTTARQISERFASRTAGMSEPLKARMSSSITANLAAAARVRGVIGSIDRRAEIAERLKAPIPTITAVDLVGDGPGPSEPFKMPDFPPLPGHETNALLRVLTEMIGDMHDIAVSTAKMQESLNDTAARAVTDFSIGAEASARASADGLRLSKGGLFVAVVSAVLAAVAIIVSIFQASGDNADLVRRERAATEQTQRLIASENRLATALEDQARALRVTEARRFEERRADQQRRAAEERLQLDAAKLGSAVRR